MLSEFFERALTVLVCGIAGGSVVAMVLFVAMKRKGML